MMLTKNPLSKIKKFKPPGSLTNRRRRQRRSVEERENAGKGWDLRLNTCLAKHVNFFLKILLFHHINQDLIILSHTLPPPPPYTEEVTEASTTAPATGNWRTTCLKLNLSIGITRTGEIVQFLGFYLYPEAKTLYVPCNKIILTLRSLKYFLWHKI